jgi:hypothetical protein
MKRGEHTTDRVGIVVVSHSHEVAKGTIDMVRQMVGNEVPLAFSGGNPAGGLGTDVASILAAKATAKWRSRCCPRIAATRSWSAMRRSSKAR